MILPSKKGSVTKIIAIFHESYGLPSIGISTYTAFGNSFQNEKQSVGNIALAADECFRGLLMILRWCGTRWRNARLGQTAPSEEASDEAFPEN